MHRIMIGILLLWIIIFGSCSNTQKEHAANLLAEWNGKVIRFPSKCYFTIGGADSVYDLSMVSSPYKIVRYVDSLGCISCKLGCPVLRS